MPCLPRILALCGARSNNVVTKLQLENIGISSDVCDIFYCQGDIEVSDDSSELIRIVEGPLYSWLNSENKHKLNESIINSVRLVLTVIAEHGPFDGIYGFSNGGLIASLVAGLADDPILKHFVNGQERGQSHWARIFNQIIPTSHSSETLDSAFDEFDTTQSNHLSAGDLRIGFHRLGVENVSEEDIDAMMLSAHGQFIERAEFHTMFHLNRAGVSDRKERSMEREICYRPFKFCILACAGLSPSQGLDSIMCSVRFLSKSNLPIPCPSFHIIGIEDKLKAQSERASCAFTFDSSHVHYISGGHAIGKEVGRDDYLCSAAKDFVRSMGNPSYLPMLADFKAVSGVSSLSVHPRDQIAHVLVNHSLLPGGINSTSAKATIIECLSSRPDHKPLMYEARNNRGTRQSKSSIGTSRTIFGSSSFRIAMTHSPRIPSCGVAMTKSTLCGGNSVAESADNSDSLSSSLHGSTASTGVGVDVGSIAQSGPSKQSLHPGLAMARDKDFQSKSFLLKRRSSDVVTDRRKVVNPELCRRSRLSTFRSSSKFSFSFKEEEAKRYHEHEALGEEEAPIAIKYFNKLAEEKKQSNVAGESPKLRRQSSIAKLQSSIKSSVSSASSAGDQTSLSSFSSKTACTTYGDALHFIQHGEGDLRKIGVKTGEVVAYCVPGASSLAAMAFLTFAAQAIAAPLSPGMTEPDALHALKQFSAKHLVLFNGVHCPGVKAAFEMYAKENKGAIHVSNAVSPDSPGFFVFKDQLDHYQTSTPLRNSEDDTCLLLRTSGTTSQPKCVPLKQKDLILNAAILASSMKLKDTDVCYSVMPLFHIGGLSASLLSTLTSGGAICSDGEPFDPSRMICALANSRPQPTWYSAVPTIHNATVAFMRDPANRKDLQPYGIKNGKWKKGHSLRMIRSGAAALLGPDAHALSRAYGCIPIFPTYSMSEQMPIAQPPAGFDDVIKDKPGSVGVPVAASLAVVSRSNYHPVTYGQEGEIAICGETSLKNYRSNPEADTKSFFYLTLPGSGITRDSSHYFLTGDVGRLDEEGFLYISGRAKELIKKGGEQVSPHEIEEVLSGHPWIEIPLCFGVPSHVYGELVGCALVLSMSAPKDVEQAYVIKSMRAWLKEKKLAPFKYPTKWIVVEEKDLPRTSSKKLVRINAASVLGLDQEEAPSQDVNGLKARAAIDWEVISGFRFCLACYVMFMHIGSNDSWGRVNALRGSPWHVHTFFILGGFSLASPMNPPISRKFSYAKNRIAHMYPQYALALIFGLLNLLVVCRPSTFLDEFHWDAQPDDLYQPDGSLSPLFCEGTPLFQHSYYGSLVSTIVVYVFGFAVTPLWPMNWWMGFYLWFSSMYYQCLAAFPMVYNYFYTSARKRKDFLLKTMFGLQLLNGIIILLAWFLMKDGKGYGHYNEESGEENVDNKHTDGVTQNIAVLSFYLFGPFWVLYFVIGTVLAFIYDAFKPANKHNSSVWGCVADGCSMAQIFFSIILICDVVQPYGEYPQPKLFRPAEADQFSDSSNINRLWDNLSGRMMAPLTTLWIYSLSTGNGHSAKILRHPFLVSTLAPLSYNCFLFHQFVAQWYYAATREGHFWNWWRWRKPFYWFSPQPVPVEWFEYFYIVGIVCFFSSFVDSTLTPIVKSLCHRLRGFTNSFDSDEDKEEVDIAEAVCNAIVNMTGIDPEMDSSLDEVGLASVGIPVIAGLMNDAFRTKKEPFILTGQDLLKAKSVKDIIEVVAFVKNRMHHDGV